MPLTRPLVALALVALAAPTITACSTGADADLSAARCEELRESKRSQQSGNTLSAQDLEDLRVQGC